MALCLAYGWLFVFAHCCSAIPAKQKVKASLFLCCAKATLLLAPKGGEPRSPPLESPIATWRAGIADRRLIFSYLYDRYLHFLLLHRPFGHWQARQRALWPLHPLLLPRQVLLQRAADVRTRQAGHCLAVVRRPIRRLWAASGR